MRRFPGGDLPEGLTATQQAGNEAAFQLVASLLDALDRPVLVSRRDGRVLFSNLHAQDALGAAGVHPKPEVNLFRDILKCDRAGILAQL